MTSRHSRPRLSTTALVCAALALALGLSGCSTDAKEPAAAASPSAATTSPEPPQNRPDASTARSSEGTGAPTRPAEWAEPGEPGAVAAATYFVELLNYLTATGDIRDWSVLSDEYCEFCGLAYSVSELYRSGGGVTGGVITLEPGASVSGDETTGIYTVAFDCSSTAAVAKDGLTHTAVSSAASSGTIVLDVGFTGSGWLLLEVREPRA